MNMLRVWAIARKEFIHVSRDLWSLIMAVAIPMLLLILFGFALKFDVDNVPLVIFDQSNSKSSHDFKSFFIASRYFSFKGSAQSYREIEQAIDSGRALVALVIPPDFARRISAGRKAQVQVIADGSDSNTAMIALGYAEAVITIYSQRIAISQVSRQGGRAVELRPRVWFNPDLESRNYIFPGLIAVIMMLIAALLTSLTIAREWETGTMEQLISTPVKGSELILGKLIPYFAIGMLDVLLAVLMGEFIFHVPLRGSILLLFAMASIFLIGGLSFGLLVSITTKNQRLATQMAMVTTYLPALLLSGATYPITNMPWVIQMITYIVPARYFVTMLKGIYLKGVGLSVLAYEALLLTVFGIIILAFARLKFKKRLE